MKNLYDTTFAFKNLNFDLDIDMVIGKYLMKIIEIFKLFRGV